MGSGETTPTMAPTHRQILNRLQQPYLVMLDTPYGFQENADILSGKIAEYFYMSLNREMHTASFRHSGQASALELETAVAAVRRSDFFFAGPGSPSYTLKHWLNSPFPELFKHKLHHGGAVVFASAAACTAGTRTLPVYEIYKAGEDPFWMEGLKLLEFPAVVVPHYNNTDGGNHDTRFCYLGERRLKILEEMLESDEFILGIDEHTACVLDLEAKTFAVTGKGSVTVRKAGESKSFATGGSWSWSELLGGGGERVVVGPQSGGQEAPAAAKAAPLADEAQKLEEEFNHGLEGRDARRALEAMLQLEQTMNEWSQDSDRLSQDKARGVLRTMMVRLGEVARPDPAEGLAPFVQTLLDLREDARANREWKRADMIRDRLLQAGLEIQDTPQGTQWRLRADATMVEIR